MIFDMKCYYNHKKVVTKGSNCDAYLFSSFFGGDDNSVGIGSI